MWTYRKGAAPRWRNCCTGSSILRACSTECVPDGRALRDMRGEHAGGDRSPVLGERRDPRAPWRRGCHGHGQGTGDSSARDRTGQPRWLGELRSSRRELQRHGRVLWPGANSVHCGAAWPRRRVEAFALSATTEDAAGQRAQFQREFLPVPSGPRDSPTARSIASAFTRVRMTAFAPMLAPPRQAASQHDALFF